MCIVFRNLNRKRLFLQFPKENVLFFQKKMHFLTQREDFFAPNQNL